MATIQQKTSRGHKYWYIVESRRIGGKPRPIVLAYLGKADDLLKRLQGVTEGVHLKSYSHGAVAALLKVANDLDVCNTINQYIESPRPYVAKKPVRNQLTAGVTFLLAAMGRVCMPTSKRGWWTWARTTSLEYLLRCNLSQIDSQHFWDLMDALPVEAIAKIEQALLKKVFSLYEVETDSLFFDTTNFFTYIATTNTRSKLAQRGKNKQKRNDLRQIGLAMAVSRQDMIPLFHLSYEGNLHDSKVFSQVVKALKKRMRALRLDIDKHTVVFDRGNNSKDNMALLQQERIHYVGALTPYQHRELIKDAMSSFQPLVMDEHTSWQVYRARREIWGTERTVIVYISEQLRAGQLRGLYQSLASAEKNLKELQQQLDRPKARKRNEEKLTDTIKKTVSAQFIASLIDWSLAEPSAGKFQLHYSIKQDVLNELEARMGFRILMTDRHDWTTQEIIRSYHGQSQVEQAFKELKNPHHLALRPQFHWSDQKIHVHNFICVLGYLLAVLVYRQVKTECAYTGSLDSLLGTLNNIRLGTLIEASTTPGKAKAVHKLEQMAEPDLAILQALNIEDMHQQRPKLKGVGVYI
ncbi:MAG: IS1634 family transposase [Arenicellales bacterium]|jgi:transposase|nr:IS1634 family transposase [Arenicellales bacterium]|tara:strand:- start:71 stop:1810 length:1740 start_codon:yes stop_codon:yes gene_type:complete